jgi:spermidine synthase
LPKRRSEVIIVMAIGPFDWWNRNAFLEFEQEDVRIYAADGEKYLFVDQTMYASTTEKDWYIANVLPRARGKCLEIGLGLGVASKVITSSKEVTHLLTVEKNPSVIGAFGKPWLKHNILHVDVMDWISSFPALEPMYDFIFVDHYTFDDDDLDMLEWVGTGLKHLLKPGGSMVFWIDDNAPEEDKEQVKKLWVL